MADKHRQDKQLTGYYQTNVGDRRKKTTDQLWRESRQNYERYQKQAGKRLLVTFITIGTFLLGTTIVFIVLEATSRNIQKEQREVPKISATQDRIVQL